MPFHHNVDSFFRFARKVVFLGKPPTDITERLENNLREANIIGSQALEAFTREAQPVLRNIQELQDSITDVVKALPLPDRVAGIKQAQEILDLPFFALLEGMIKTLEIVENQSRTTIKNLKKGQRKPPPKTTPPPPAREEQEGDQPPGLPRRQRPRERRA